MGSSSEFLLFNASRPRIDVVSLCKPSPDVHFGIARSDHPVSHLHLPVSLRSPCIHPCTCTYLFIIYNISSHFLPQIHCCTCRMSYHPLYIQAVCVYVYVCALSHCIQSNGMLYIRTYPAAVSSCMLCCPPYYLLLLLYSSHSHCHCISSPLTTLTLTTPHPRHHLHLHLV